MSYKCVCTNSASISHSPGWYCSTSEMLADERCDDYCSSLGFGSHGEIEPPEPCDEMATSMSCTGWDPASEVTYNSGTNTYVVDYGFAATLYANSEALVACDGATISLGQDGFEVANASSGDLLYLLGLRNGDILLEVNDIPLDSYLDVANAIVELWLTDDETSYTLEIERNQTWMSLNYFLSAT